MNMAKELLTGLGRRVLRYPDDRYVPSKVVGLQDKGNALRNSGGEEVRSHNVHVQYTPVSGGGAHGYDGTKYEQVDMSLTQNRGRL